MKYILVFSLLLSGCGINPTNVDLNVAHMCQHVHAGYPEVCYYVN